MLEVELSDDSYFYDMKEGNLLYEKAYAFAIRVVKAYQFLNEEKREFVLSKQLLRAGTSIGANVSEANGAISKADFSNKISIAYKECLETKYWLSLLKDTGFIEEKVYISMNTDAQRIASRELSKLLYAILKTTRIDKQ
ncbi:four helix bundle protein [Telluribacter humicola]